MSIDQWPTFRITGGPHSKNTKLFVDGVEAHGLHHLDVTFNVNDAVRLKAQSFAKAIEMEVQGVITWQVFLDRIVRAEDTEEGTYMRLPIHGEGTSLIQALLDLAAKLSPVNRKEDDDQA